MFSYDTTKQRLDVRRSKGYKSENGRELDIKISMCLNIQSRVVHLLAKISFSENHDYRMTVCKQTKYDPRRSNELSNNKHSGKTWTETVSRKGVFQKDNNGNAKLFGIDA